MFNISIISLMSLILIYQNILLLNEETLILICFVIFCWIAFTKLNELIYDDLKQRSTKIENSLINSLNQVFKVLNHSIKFNQNFKNLSSNFESLGNHFFKLGAAISNELPNYLSNKSKNVYVKKFIFVQRLERQTTKLLAILIIQKINKLVSVQKFYTYNLKISNFICFQTINLLKYLKNL
uniref:ATP synthase B chain n=1 Tax=Riquetophycus sp. HSY-2014a TaxID=1488470 RepID=A0A0E3DBK1_9FLOR|nr:ATP synthase B chain precursor [Riquetophycus sp. HSY-2014a]